MPLMRQGRKQSIAKDTMLAGDVIHPTAGKSIAVYGQVVAAALLARLTSWILHHGIMPRRT